MTPFYKKHFSESGRTILEILAVISVLGLITAGVFTMARNVFEQRNTNDVVQKIENYVHDIKNAFAWVDSYDFSAAEADSAGDKIKSCASDNDIPKITCYLKTQKIIKGINDNGQIISNGGIITFGSGPVASSDSYFSGTFTIIASDISMATCITILNHDWGDALYDYSADAVVNTGFSTSTTKYHTAADLPPLSIPAARTACLNKNIIQLKFK